MNNFWAWDFFNEITRPLNAITTRKKRKILNTVKISINNQKAKKILMKRIEEKNDNFLYIENKPMKNTLCFIFYGIYLHADRFKEIFKISWIHCWSKRSSPFGIARITIFASNFMKKFHSTSFQAKKRSKIFFMLKIFHCSCFFQKNAFPLNPF